LVDGDLFRRQQSRRAEWASIFNQADEESGGCASTPAASMERNASSLPALGQPRTLGTMWPCRNVGRKPERFRHDRTGRHGRCSSAAGNLASTSSSRPMATRVLVASGQGEPGAVVSRCPEGSNRQFGGRLIRFISVLRREERGPISPRYRFPGYAVFPPATPRHSDSASSSPMMSSTTALEPRQLPLSPKSDCLAGLHGGPRAVSAVVNPGSRRYRGSPGVVVTVLDWLCHPSIEAIAVLVDSDEVAAVTRTSFRRDVISISLSGSPHGAVPMS